MRKGSKRNDLESQKKRKVLQASNVEGLWCLDTRKKISPPEPGREGNSFISPHQRTARNRIMRGANTVETEDKKRKKVSTDWYNK